MKWTWLALVAVVLIGGIGVGYTMFRKTVISLDSKAPVMEKPIEILDGHVLPSGTKISLYVVKPGKPHTFTRADGTPLKNPLTDKADDFEDYVSKLPSADTGIVIQLDQKEQDANLHLVRNQRPEIFDVQLFSTYNPKIIWMSRVDPKDLDEVVFTLSEGEWKEYAVASVSNGAVKTRSGPPLEFAIASGTVEDRKISHITLKVPEDLKKRDFILEVVGKSVYRSLSTATFPGFKETVDGPMEEIESITVYARERKAYGIKVKL